MEHHSAGRRADNADDRIYYRAELSKMKVLKHCMSDAREDSNVSAPSKHMVTL